MNTFNNHILPWIVLIVVITTAVATCKDKSKFQIVSETISQDSVQVIKPDYKQLRAKHVDSNVITTVAVYEADNFKPGDTILSRFWATENCLQVIYHLPVDRAQGVIKLVIIE